MTDIVKRLRAGHIVLQDLREEAADEIERLRERVRRLEAEDQGEEVDRLYAERTG